MHRQILRTPGLLLLVAGACSCSPIEKDQNPNAPTLPLTVDEIIKPLASSTTGSRLYASGTESIEGRRYQRWNNGETTLWIAESRGKVAAVILEYKFSSLDGLISMEIVMNTALGASPMTRQKVDDEFGRVLEVLSATRDGPATAIVAGREVTAKVVSSGGRGRYIRMSISASPPEDALPLPHVESNNPAPQASKAESTKNSQP